MSNEDISKDEVMAVFPKVAEILADALGCDLEEVKPESFLIKDLDAESIDFLDIVFRLEREFKVKIPQGQIGEDARGDLSEEEFEVDGVVSEKGMERLRAFFSEVPEEHFAPPFKSAQIPALFTAETFCKVVIQRQRLGNLPEPGMAEHFRAFTFVDRIESVDLGVEIRGSYAIPSHLESFPSSLVAESIGQLAAWAAMAEGNFARRPVAGIAGKVAILSEVKPGYHLELSARIESVDADSMKYRGIATVNGNALVELQDCLGPMMPLDEFDDPESLRKHFDRLCAGAVEPGGFGGIPDLAYERTGGEDGESATATLKVPESAPFFADHFPRRPVFPGTLLMNMNLELAAELADDQPGAAEKGRWKLESVSDVKLRSFIPPGAELEVKAKVRERSDKALTVHVETKQAGGKRIGAALVTFNWEASA